MGLNNIPLLNADIVTGISLMLAFIAFGFYLNWGTVLLAHITFSIPYVILSVMPKMKQIGRQSFEAALDLGCTPNMALRKVVLVELVPGILSGFMTSVTLTLDDYFITTYTKPAAFDTISTYVVNATKGAQTQVKTALWALSTVFFIVVLISIIAMNLNARRAAKIREEELR